EPPINAAVVQAAPCLEWARNDGVVAQVADFSLRDTPVVPRPRGRDQSLAIKVARQGKVGPLITKGGLKSHGHNLPIGLKSGTVGSAVEIAKRGAHLAADTKSGIEWAARTQTRQQEVGIGIFGVRITDGDDFAIA